jgi:hypothetical protein
MEIFAMSEGSMGPVRKGLSWVYAGLFGSFVAMILSHFFHGPESNNILLVLNTLPVVVLLVGQSRCLGGPREMPGRTLVVLSIICTLLSLGLNLSLFFWSPVNVLGNFEAMLALSLLGGVLAWSGDLAFMFFLKKLANYRHDQRNARTVGVLIVLKIIVITLLMGAVVLLLRFIPGPALMLLMLAGILSLMILFQYLSLVTELSYQLLRSSKHLSDANAPIENPFENFSP